MEELTLCDIDAPQWLTANHNCREFRCGQALVCQAIDDRAKAFYLHQGWRLSPIDPMLLMVPL